MQIHSLARLVSINHITSGNRLQETSIILRLVVSSHSIRLPIAQERNKSRMRSLIACRTLVWLMALSIVHKSSAFSASLACDKASRGVSWTRVHACTDSDDGITVSRRGWLGSLATFGAIICVPFQAALAEEPTATVTAPVPIKTEVPTAPPVPMRDFVDPKGLFSIRIPKGYFALRREAKGDLPDEKTGKGRRGSNIFTAGDMGKAEVIAVER